MGSNRGVQKLRYVPQNTRLKLGRQPVGIRYFAERNLYVPTREIVRQDAYQAQVIRIQFGSPVGWAA